MSQVFIIAEAGVNHNGRLDLAFKLIDEAAKAGADAVKFQTFIPEKLVSQFAQKAEYQKETTGKKQSQLQMLQQLSLTKENFESLQKYCEEKKIKFMSSPFDIESIDMLEELGIEEYKIPSGEITNYPYLKKIAQKNKRIILSTGMSTIDDISAAFNLLVRNGVRKEKITILHCNTEYPTPMKDVNLKAMLQLKSVFDVEVGYSDHTLGVEIPIAAVALGAKVIEKHFTLDKNLDGPDHRASLSPIELGLMVSGIRNIELALGDGEKKPSQSEIKNMTAARKSIVAKKNILKDEVFSEDNIEIKRPGSGINPMDWEKVLGEKAKRKFLEDELIEL